MNTTPSRQPLLRNILLKWTSSQSRTTEQLRWISKHFDSVKYLAANPDVAAAGVNPLRHFMSYGLLEGRAPESGISNLRCRQELVGAFGTEHDLRRQVARLQRILKASPENLAQPSSRTTETDLPFWARSDFAARVIDVCHVRDSAHWASGRATRESAVRQFAKQFETRLLPFSLELVPDPEFYRALHGDALTALEIQQIWARSESEDQTIVSLAHFLRIHCGDASLIYSGFDHLDYLARNPSVDLRLNEFQAFAHFIVSGLEQGFRPPRTNSPALVSIIDARLERLNETGSLGLFKAATKLVDAGIRSDVITRFACQHAIANGFEDIALAMLQTVFRRQTSPESVRDRLSAFWISYYLATELAQQGRYNEAVPLSQEALDIENGSVLALEKAHETVSLWHQNIHRGLRVAARSGGPMPDELTVSSQFTAILQAVPSFQSGLPRVLRALPRRSIRRIGILADLSLPQCKRYRVDQKLEYLTTLGIDFTVFDVHREVDRAVSDCALFDAWLLYRTPAYYGVLELLNRTQALALPTVFEIDDLILAPGDFPEARENYGSGVDDQLYAEFNRHSPSGLPSASKIA